MRFWPLVLLEIAVLSVVFWATGARAVPLDTWPTWNTDFPYIARQVPPSALIVRGSGTDEYYVLEVDPTTGAIPVDIGGSPIVPDVAFDSGPVDSDTQRVTEGGRAYADSTRLDYSITNVTTGAWVELDAALAQEINWLMVFDSCGQTMELGVGAAASETRFLLYGPGGVYGVPVNIPTGSRLSIRAVSGNCSLGEISLTGMQ